MYQFNIHEVEVQVLERMKQLNCEPINISHLMLDGKIHRYAVNGDKGSNKAGAYCIFLDHWPAGWIYNWRTGVNESWCFNRDKLDDEGKKYFDDPKVQDAIQKSREHQKKLQEELNMKKLHASDEARARFNSMPTAPDDHPYLQNKHVRNFGLHWQSDINALVVPLLNIDDTIVSVQYIYPDGQKKFAALAPTKGAFFRIALDTLQYDKNYSVPILICEGYATAATIYELTNYPTVAAMNCHNLGVVAEALKQKYPNRKIIFLADNDNKTDGNPGISCAEEANNRLKLNGIIAPTFKHNESGSDWNDYFKIHGEQNTAYELRKQIYEHCQPAHIQKLLQRVECINAQALRSKVFAPLKWAVDGFLAAGLTILAGGPKVGKSIMSLHIGLGVAIGGCVLGKIFVKKGDVLYLALEDTQRRLQERIDGSDLLHEEDISGLDLITQIPRQHEGGMDYIRWWLEHHPEARLVIIDTLQKFRKQLSGKNSMYSEDYDVVSDIKKLADEFDVAFLIVHHLKKSNLSNDWLNGVSGSQGIAGSADTVLSLERARGENNGILHRTGRDVEEKDFSMRLNGYGWILEGETEEFTMSAWKRSIIDYLKEHDAASPIELADALKMNSATLRKNLLRLIRDGKVEKVGFGRYSIKG